VTSASTTSVNLRWRSSRDNVRVSGYRVYANGNYDGSTRSTSYTVDHLKCGTAYTFSVAAYDRAGNRSGSASVVSSTTPCATPAGTPPSGNSSPGYSPAGSGTPAPPPAGSTTPPPPPPAPQAVDSQAPSTPANLTLNGATTSSLSVSWSASSDNVGVSSYGVYLDGATVASPSSTTHTLSGLSCGVTYQIDVDAVDAKGNRSGKVSLSGSTAACPDTTAPTSPQFPIASGTTISSITVTWLSSWDGVGVTGYGVYRGTTRLATVVEPGLSYTFTGLACGTGYSLSVDAFDAAGNVSPKSTISASTSACADTTKPSAPSGLAVSSVTQTGLTFGWATSTDNVGVAGYTVFRNGSLLGQTSATSYPVGGLSCGTSYSLAVEARDAAGNVSSRPSISASTSACPAQPPPPPPPSAPSLAALTFVSPTASTLSGLVTWEVTSPVAVSRIDYSIDGGSTRWTEYVAPFMFNGDPDGRLDTSTLSNGSHTLTVDAYDAAGAKVATASRTVTVSNSASTPAPPPPTTPPPPPPPPPAATPPPPPPPAPASTGSCSTTLSSGLAAAIQSASAGATICLNSGSYGNLSLTSVGKSADVTVRPATGADVTIGRLTFRMVNHLRFTGEGGSMKIGGLDLDPSDSDNSWSHHLTFDQTVWTAATTVRTRGSNQAILFDSSVFDNLGVGMYEGRLSVRGYNNTQPVGVTISNSHFGGGGCSDGVQIIGNAYGVQILNNEFEDLQQGSCAAHVDSIQLYGSRYTVIDGNYFHGNSIAIMAPDGGDHEQITNNVIVAGGNSSVVQLGSHHDGLVAHNTFVGGVVGCGDHKSGASPSTNQTCRDNVFTGDFYPTDPSGLVEDYNLCRPGEPDCKGAHDVKATAMFVGGTNPSSYAGYRLAAGSPGKNAASDGTDIGISG
jgi:chitodextrinase